MIVGLQKDYRIASLVLAGQYWNPVAVLFGVVEGGRIFKDFEALSKLCDPPSSSYYPSTKSSDGIAEDCRRI